MQLYVFPLILAAGLACGGAPATHEPPRAVAAELALLETHATIDGAALPPRADAPRTVVMFFASW